MLVQQLGAVPCPNGAVITAASLALVEFTTWVVSGLLYQDRPHHDQNAHNDTACTSAHVCKRPAQVCEPSRMELARNKLTCIPDSLCALETLTALDLSANQLASLPPSMTRLTALATLQLQQNSLQARDAMMQSNHVACYWPTDTHPKARTICARCLHCRCCHPFQAHLWSSMPAATKSRCVGVLTKWNPSFRCTVSSWKQFACICDAELQGACKQCW